MRDKNITLKAALVGIGISTLTTQVSAQALEEVVVTAQKREQGLGDVPLSMQVVSGDALENQDIYDFKGLVEQLPNVYLAAAPGISSIAIRGVGTGSETASAEQAVGMYIDGMYVSRGYQFNAPFTDVQRVEVLKGPQGVLQGKNSVAGAVVITTRRPTQEFEALLRTGYEVENEGYNLEGVVSGPISENLSGRLVAQQNVQGGWLDTNTRMAANGTTVLKGEDNQNEDEFYIVRSSLVWEPSETLSLFGKAEVGERKISGISFGGAGIQPGAIVGGPSNNQTPIIDFYLSKDPNYNTIDNGVVSNGFANAYNPDINLFEATNQDIEGKVENSSFTGQADWETNLGTVTGISTYAEFNQSNNLANTMAPLDWLYQNSPKGNGGEQFDQFTQEVRLVSPGGETIDYVVGAFYMDRSINMDGASSILNISNGGLGGPTFGDSQFQRLFKETTNSWSVFGQLTWNITDTLRANAGVRYSDETKKVNASTSGDFLVDFPPGNQAILDGFGIEYYTEQDKLGESNTDPSVSVQWDATDDIMLYASYTQATKAGGFNSSANEPDNLNFGPETAKGYEMGLKGAFFDGRLATNVSAYYTKYDDLQVGAFDAATNSFLFQNAATAITQGMEADVRYAWTENVEIGGALAYLDAYYDDFPGASCSVGTSVEANCDLAASTRNAKDDKLRFSPEWTGNLYAHYRYDLSNGMEVGLRGEAVFSDDYYWAAQNDPFMQQDSYAKLNLSASLTSPDGNWRVSVVGKNLTDKTTSSFGGATPQMVGAYWSNVDAPRQVFLSAEYRWF